MTPEELNAIEARANAATPGPWKPMQFNLICEGDPHEGDEYGYEPGGPKLLDDGEYSYFTLEDCRFMCSARADVPKLVAEVRRLWALLQSAGIEVLDE